jgi:hypothetical protein
MTLAGVALAGWLAAADPPTTAAAVATAPPETIWSIPGAHTAGLLGGMRLSLSLIWPGPYSPLPLDERAESFGHAFTRPPEFRRPSSAGDLLTSDGDPWVINVVGHGLFGAEAYGRVRACGGGPGAALLFAAGASTVWEYGIESWNKRPSAVDLVLTPLLGAALGEGRHQLQRWLRTRPASGWRRAAEIVIDPLGEAERGILGTRC